MKRLLKWVLKYVCALVFYAALLAGGYKLLKHLDRAAKFGLWPAEAQLDSIDPLERAEAARAAAKKYGGEP
jgi:hypothetical protein